MIRHDVQSSTQRDKALATATLRVEMIADLVCPWCYLGKRRLDTALASVHGPHLVGWKPFQLNPDMPPQGVTLDDYLASRFGDPQAVRPGLEELTRVGHAEGVNFRFDRLTRVPNTLGAHQLMLYAAAEGVPVEDVAEGLFKAFFEDGRDISDAGVLADIGNANGLERAAILQMLDDGRFRKQVLGEEGQLRRSGVTAVPNFLVNDRLFVVGAQPAAALVDVFDRAMFGAESDQPLEGSVH
ncbi:MAG TPA: DsbA family oxidoreductase [Woeseiaceae bacterium]|nr:DsbA family oxidoreductase [Woeseiaceae bacterium]